MYIFVLEPGGFARLEWLRGKIFKIKKSEKSGVGAQQKPSCHQWIFKTPFQGEGAIFQGDMRALSWTEGPPPPRATTKVSG